MNVVYFFQMVSNHKTDLLIEEPQLLRGLNSISGDHALVYLY